MRFTRKGSVGLGPRSQERFAGESKLRLARFKQDSEAQGAFAAHGQAS
jgi:hypothetical protein